VMKMNQDDKVTINLEDFKSKRSTHSVKETAHRAFKRFKVGLSITDYERKLIEIYYPFLINQDYNEKRKEEDGRDSFL
jgi:hypothetical protein